MIQVPNGPFGLSRCQGDLETDEDGYARQTFVGRFNEETFIVAPGTASAPVVHNNGIPDAASNPQTGPVHTYHLGLWFNSPDDAAKAGCANTVTPFNGEHNAGVQILNTSNFRRSQRTIIIYQAVSKLHKGTDCVSRSYPCLSLLVTQKRSRLPL